MKIKDSYILVIFPGLGQDMLKKTLEGKKAKVLSLNVVNRKNPGQFINIEGSKAAASEAIDAARTGKFDVILVDSILPVKYDHSAVFVPNSMDVAIKILGAPFDKMTDEIAEALNQFKKEGVQSRLISVDSPDALDKVALEFLDPVLPKKDNDSRSNFKDRDKERKEDKGNKNKDERPPRKSLFTPAPLSGNKAEVATEQAELEDVGEEDNE